MTARNGLLRMPAELPVTLLMERETGEPLLIDQSNCCPLLLTEPGPTYEPVEYSTITETEMIFELAIEASKLIEDCPP